MDRTPHPETNSPVCHAAATQLNEAHADRTPRSETNSPVCHAAATQLNEAGHDCHREDALSDVAVKELGTTKVMPEATEKMFLNIFTHAKTQTLAPVHPKGERWEKVTAIMDSGATVTVRNPQTGDAYPIREGAASKAGVMYEIADGTEIPNLGERIMAIMKTDGTVTAQRSQAANVSKNLTAVRQEMKNNKTVIFDSDGCYTYDKLSGSFTAIDDDGVNFTQDEWIIPPDELGQVLAALSDPDFTGQAP